MPAVSEAAKKHAYEQQRKWVEKNRCHVNEYARIYAQKTRERRRAAQKKYRDANPDEVKAKRKAWWDDNPGYRETYYAKNRLHHLVKMAQHRAKKYGVPFDLREVDLVIPDICPVLGIPIKMNSRGGFNPSSPSIDRIIPSLGYVMGNVCIISNRANLLKRDGTADELSKVALWLAAETARVKAGD